MLRAIKTLLPQRSPIRLLWHLLKACAAAIRFGFPARTLTIIGITGTDGKTTTVGMTAHILARHHKDVGALSTAFFQVRDSITWNSTQKTSPSPFTIQKFLRRLVDEGCTHAVLEYSSHGLVQSRSRFTWPRVAAITNTSLEHLDYHGTMEQYRRDKGKLFRMLRRSGTKVLNRLDDTYGLYVQIPSQHTIAYAREKVSGGKEDVRLWLTDIQSTAASSSAVLHMQKAGASAEETIPLALSIPGSFNLENALCALSCTRALGIPLHSAAASLADFAGVPGRMERIDEGQPFTVIVDFTVTPVSYERTLGTLRSALTSPQRLLVLTGSCGDRMREKRPLIGKICSELADVVVVSNEDPYTEDPEKIIDEIWQGIDQKHTEAHRIVDRREAISFLFAHARPGDIVLLCGKGSDTTMWVKNGQIPWNEREIVREMLQGYRKTSEFHERR